MNASTIDYIQSLMKLKEGELGILRSLHDSSLDESIVGFDLYTNIWWPLRKKNKMVPRREVAWLIAKLYAHYRLIQKDDASLPKLLGFVYRSLPGQETKDLFIDRFDLLLNLEVNQLEQPLHQALMQLRNFQYSSLDWVRLTDDLSIWEEEKTRLKWAEVFYNTITRNQYQEV